MLFLQSFSNGYSTFVNLKFKRKNFTILSAYFSPFDNFSQQLLNIKNSINSIGPKNLIIGMDSNAKSRVWINARDEKEAIISTNSYLN